MDFELVLIIAIIGITYFFANATWVERRIARLERIVKHLYQESHK